MVPKPVTISTGLSGIRLLSAIRGRARWEVRAIHRRPHVARQLEKALSQHAEVLSVHANPVSGRVLIFYTQDASNQKIVSLLIDFLEGFQHDEVPRAPVSENGSPLSRILKRSLPRGEQLVVPTLTSIAGHTLQMLRGLSYVGILNTARGEGPRFLRTLGFVRAAPRLLFMTALTLLLAGASLWLQHRRRQAWRNLAQTTRHTLRTQLLTSIEAQDMAFFDKYGTGHLIDLVVEDTQRVAEFVEKVGDETIEKVLVIAVAGTFLVVASPTLALLACLPLPFILLSSRIFGRMASERYARVGETSNRFSQILENNLVGITDVKSFTAEGEEVRRLSECDLRLSEYARDAGSVSSLQSTFAGSAFSFGYVVTVGYGGLLAVRGGMAISEYIRVFYWFPLLVEALTNVDQVVKLFYSASSASKQLAGVLESEPTIRSGPMALPQGKAHGLVSFENVTFGYDPAFKVIQNVSFQVRPGETLAIVGPTGSGKSTLFRLLMRFFDVQSGRILLDGNDIRELNLQHLRGTVSLVSQDVHLFQGTVRDNIVYGRHDVSEAEMTTALRDARANTLLKTLPDGLDTLVGERGQRLSGGEKQRVAIARALLKLRLGASILALDEATSHLDNKTEADLKTNLSKVASGKSVIMIAHRLSTIRSADRVLVLERGRIIEEGNHEELLARKGLYASLWQLQNGKRSRGGGSKRRVEE